MKEMSKFIKSENDNDDEITEYYLTSEKKDEFKSFNKTKLSNENNDILLTNKSSQSIRSNYLAKSLEFFKKLEEPNHAMKL
jgi:hypothetical protein